jgi:hypothetical protein
MTAETGSLDPYRSPSLPEGVYAGPRPVGRPGWLSAVCVLCIVLGALGLMNSLFGTVGLIAGPRFQRFMAAQPQPGMQEDLKKAQEKFRENMYEIQMNYIWPLSVSILMRVVVCTLLLVGGIRALNMVEPGRRLLIIACAIALVFDLLQAILQLVMTVENMTVTNEFMEAMANQGGSTPKEVEAVIKTIGFVIRFVVLGMVCVFALAKIAFYIFAVLYLQKPNIMALFHTKSAPPSPALTSDH